jgi:hypothetical protein
VALQKHDRLAPADKWMVGDLETRLARVGGSAAT